MNNPLLFVAKANYMFFDGFTNMLGGTLFGKFLPQVRRYFSFW